MTREPRPILEQQIREKAEFLHDTSRMIHEMHDRWTKLLSTDPVRVVYELLIEEECHRILTEQARQEMITQWGYDPTSGTWQGDPAEDMLTNPRVGQVWIRFHASATLCFVINTVRAATQAEGWELVPWLCPESSVNGSPL